MEKETTKVSKDYYEEEIDYFLHRNGDEDDATVILNGTAIKVPRGRHVKLKRKYALILDASENDKINAEDKMRKLSEGER
jgi:hypothetical protein